MRPAAAMDADDLLLPAARRRAVIVFMALTVSLLLVLPALFLSIDWPGWGFAAALTVGQILVIGLHSWWFHRTLRHPPARRNRQELWMGRPELITRRPSPARG